MALNNYEIQYILDELSKANDKSSSYLDKLPSFYKSQESLNIKDVYRSGIEYIEKLNTNSKRIYESFLENNFTTKEYQNFFESFKYLENIDIVKLYNKINGSGQMESIVLSKDKMKYIYDAIQKIKKNGSNKKNIDEFFESLNFNPELDEFPPSVEVEPNIQIQATPYQFMIDVIYTKEDGDVEIDIDTLNYNINKLFALFLPAHIFFRTVFLWRETKRLENGSLILNTSENSFYAQYIVFENNKLENIPNKIKFSYYEGDIQNNLSPSEFSDLSLYYVYIPDFYYEIKTTFLTSTNILEIMTLLNYIGYIGTEIPNKISYSDYPLLYNIPTIYQDILDEYYLYNNQSYYQLDSSIDQIQRNYIKSLLIKAGVNDEKFNRKFIQLKGKIVDIVSMTNINSNNIEFKYILIELEDNTIRKVYIDNTIKRIYYSDVSGLKVSTDLFSGTNGIKNQIVNAIGENIIVYGFENIDSYIYYDGASIITKPEYQRSGSHLLIGSVDQDDPKKHKLTYDGSCYSENYLDVIYNPNLSNRVFYNSNNYVSYIGTVGEYYQFKTRTSPILDYKAHLLPQQWVYPFEMIDATSPEGDLIHPFVFEVYDPSTGNWVKLPVFVGDSSFGRLWIKISDATAQGIFSFLDVRASFYSGLRYNIKKQSYTYFSFTLFKNLYLKDPFVPNNLNNPGLSELFKTKHPMLKSSIIESFQYNYDEFGEINDLALENVYYDHWMANQNTGYFYQSYSNQSCFYLRTLKTNNVLANTPELYKIKYTTYDYEKTFLYNKNFYTYSQNQLFESKLNNFKFYSVTRDVAPDTNTMMDLSFTDDIIKLTDEFEVPNYPYKNTSLYQKTISSYKMEENEEDNNRFMIYDFQQYDRKKMIYRKEVIRAIDVMADISLLYGFATGEEVDPYFIEISYNSYQKLGLMVQPSDDTTLLPNTTYYFLINGLEYSITTGDGFTTFSALVQLINAIIYIDSYLVGLYQNSPTYDLTFIGVNKQIHLDHGVSGLDLFNSIIGFVDFKEMFINKKINAVDGADLAIDVMKLKILRPDLIPYIYRNESGNITIDNTYMFFENKIYGESDFESQLEDVRKMNAILYTDVQNLPFYITMDNGSVLDGTYNPYTESKDIMLTISSMLRNEKITAQYGNSEIESNNKLNEKIKYYTTYSNESNLTLKTYEDESDGSLFTLWWKRKLEKLLDFDLYKNIVETYNKNINTNSYMPLQTYNNREITSTLNCNLYSPSLNQINFMNFNPNITDSYYDYFNPKLNFDGYKEEMIFNYSDSNILHNPSIDMEMNHSNNNLVERWKYTTFNNNSFNVYNSGYNIYYMDHFTDLIVEHI